MTSELSTASLTEILVSSFAALSRGDVEGHLANCAEDIVVEFPFADPPVRIDGATALRAYLSKALSIFHFTLTIDRILAAENPGCLVVEFSSTGSVTTTGKAYANSYIGIFEFLGAKLRFQREYYNPLRAQEALRV